MRKHLLTLSLSILSLTFLSSKGLAQEIPGYYSNGLSTEEADLSQFKLVNYPNPVTIKTTVKFSIPENATVSLKLYNISGQLVTTIYAGHAEAGSHKIDFDAGNIAHGIYVCRLIVIMASSKKSLSRMIDVVK